ncbi:MAG: hypothetical protein LUH04_13260 [Clostridium sp.]|nr:hypothetical protein [Clostridium sp.]
MKYVGDKVSYIRHPFAKNSYFSLVLGLVCMLLATISMILSVRSAGQGDLVTGALGFSSIAAAIMGIWFGLISFMEKEKNYILAKIGVGIALVVIIFWLMVLVVALR